MRRAGILHTHRARHIDTHSACTHMHDVEGPRSTVFTASQLLLGGLLSGLYARRLQIVSGHVKACRSTHLRVMVSAGCKQSHSAVAYTGLVQLTISTSHGTRKQHSTASCKARQPTAGPPSQEDNKGYKQCRRLPARHLAHAAGCIPRADCST